MVGRPAACAAADSLRCNPRVRVLVAAGALRLFCGAATEELRAGVGGGCDGGAAWGIYRRRAALVFR